jgi:hypothetical protein
VIEDAGGGALRLRASGVTMTLNTIIRGATGTFQMEVNGTITRITR